MEESILMYSVLYSLEEYTLPVERGIRYKVQRTVKSSTCAHLKGIHGSQGIVPLFIILDTRQGEWSTSHPSCSVLRRVPPLPSEQDTG
jgi:hypothetical protein